jgi:ribosomal protein S17
MHKTVGLSPVLYEKIPVLPKIKTNTTHFHIYNPSTWEGKAGDFVDYIGRLWVKKLKNQKMAGGMA